MNHSGFKIKQATPRTAENMAKLMGDVSLHVARKILADAPKMPPGSVVHEAACGNGPALRGIMETQDVANVDKFHATDIQSSMCEATLKVAESGPPGWAAKLKAEVMPCDNLQFADNMFSHSHLGFVIFATPDPDKVASEMYRTMRKGDSVGYVTTWHMAPSEHFTLAAHTATRPADSKHMFQKLQQWKDPEYVQKLLEKAGFAVEMSKVDTVMDVEDMKKWGALAWGFVGEPLGGWTQEDEDRFDEAVDVMMKSIESSPYFTSNGKGGGQLKFVANVATVRKN